MRLIFILFYLFALTIGCNKQQKTEPFTLHSGKFVNMIEFARKQSKNPPDDFITFEYISNIDFAKDESLLKPELDDIWITISPVVEERKVEKVTIIVHSKPKGNWLASSKTKTSFVSHKNADGTWQ